MADNGHTPDGRSKWKLVTTADGYRSIEPRPDITAQKTFYNHDYYAKGRTDNQYTHEYTDAELRHKRLAYAEAERIADRTGSDRRYLDLGCGEGFGIAYFHQRNWDVTGLDFTLSGIEQYFPSLADHVRIADLFEEIDRLVAEGRQYDLIAANNLLEHVIDPDRLIASIFSLLSPTGIARIAVPNDGSWLHELLVSTDRARSDFYVCPPDHLHYFNIPSLRRFLQRNGMEILDLLAEFPVDLFLLNPDSNYLMDKSLGRNCHFARVDFELGLWDQSIDAVIAFRRGCAAAGIGRDIIAYVTARR